MTDTFLPLNYLVVTVVAFDPTGAVANSVAFVVPFELRVVDSAEGTLVGFAFADC